LFAVHQQADATVTRAFGLAELGALYAARAEFMVALETITRALDTQFSDARYSQALAAAQKSLREAEDFLPRQGKGRPPADLSALVARHHTPVLKRQSLEKFTAVSAAQQYFAYAQLQMAAACGNAPAASRALYGIGKIHMALAEESPPAERMNGPKAMAYHHAALLVDSRNSLAANELGVLLARLGQLIEARATLIRAASIGPRPETWHNLAVVHQRLGEWELARLASMEHERARSQAISSSPPSAPAAQPSIQWVAPQAFAEASPAMTPPHRTESSRDETAYRGPVSQPH
jgi:tetratricopeptide (TPR) repeat protein